MNSTIVNDTLYLYLETERTPLRWYMIAVDVFLASFLIAFGFAGNVISILILQKDERMRRVTRMLLQALAVTDMLYLFCSIFYQPLFAIAFDPVWGQTFIQRYLPIEPFVSPLISITSMAGTWTIVLITTGRYITMCYPHKAKTIFDFSKIRFFLVGIWVFAIIFNIVRFTGAEIPHKRDPKTGGVILILPLRDDLQYDPTYNLVYQVILAFLFRNMGPMLILLFLNFSLIWQIQKIKRNVNTSGAVLQSLDHASKRVTLMLVVVVFIFVICMIPTLYVRSLWLRRVMGHKITLAETHKMIYDDQLMYAYSTAKIFMTLNSSVNFVVYVMLGKQFRKNLKHTLSSSVICK